MWPETLSAHNEERKRTFWILILPLPLTALPVPESTIAAAARRFGLIYVDTGAIYRTVGLAGERAGVNCSDADAMQALLPALRIELVYDAAGEQRMLLNGEDVSETIRLPEVSLLASRVSALPVVRAFLLDMQRSLARTHSVVMDGRDIGTVVLPDAGLKIFFCPPRRSAARSAAGVSCRKRVFRSRMPTCCVSSSSAIMTIPTVPLRRSRQRRTPCTSTRAISRSNRALMPCAQPSARAFGLEADA